MIRVRGEAKAMLTKDLILNKAELVVIPCCHLPENKKSKDSKSAES
tara:strand:+ start:2252 stop:2389 length:138 start_codon:yes stop_codon:yes gene_type:complete